MSKAQEIIDEFSFIEGGLFRKVQVKLGVANHQVSLALAGICFAWLPLVIMTTGQGNLYDGVSMPFIMDIGLQARLLIALPMLILVRNTIDIKTTAVIRYMTESLLDTEQRSKMISATLPRMRRWACSSFTEVVLILIVIGSVLGQVKGGVYGGLVGEGTSWKFSGLPEDNVLNLAGKWATFISVPLFRFLLLQWIWRYIVWIALLYHFSTSGMKLLPTHADRAGGLGILIFAQRSFSFVFMAGSFLISGQLVVFILRSPGGIQMVQQVVIGYIILCLVLLIFPLLFFIGQLAKTKQLGLLHLSELGTQMSSRFEKDWLNEKPLEKRIEEKQVDPSMAYDYASMYDNLQQLRIIPVTLRDIIGLVVSLALPFLPILFIYFSAAEVLQKILGLLM